MKRFTACLLTLVLVLGTFMSGGLCASAAEALPENCCLLGDFDGNGQLNAVDARWALQTASGTRSYDTARMMMLDCNNDGRLNAVDARYILQMAAGVRGKMLVHVGTGAREPYGVPIYTKAQAAELVRAYTQRAAAGGYTVNGVCKITKDVDVGSATATLNQIIQRVDPNADINSVVGAFLGTGEQSYTVCAGETSVGRYDLQAFTFSEADIADYRQADNVLYIRLKDCKNPQKNGAQTLSKVTSAFPTEAEVRAAMQEIGVPITVSKLTSNVSDILLTVTLSDSGLESVRLHFVNDLTLNLRMSVVGIDGTGQTTTDIVYSDFVN